MPSGSGSSCRPKVMAYKGEQRRPCSRQRLSEGQMQTFFPVLIILLAGPASAQSHSEVHTLYRNSALDASMRVHVATFDSIDGSLYNAENCNLAADLFQRQEGVKTRFWCEKGRFHK
jgi:hypothetical protein